MSRTVLIVDDHPGFRSSARRVLEADGYRVVGEAQDGRSGIAAARALRPGIVLLDVHLPDLDGFEVAAALTGPDDAPIVVLTSSRDDRDFQCDDRAQRRPRVRREGRTVWSCARGAAEMIGPRRALLALGVGAFARGLIAIAVILPSNHVNPRGLGPAAAPAIGWSVAGVGVVRR